MAKATIDEVEVLRFFETESLDKVTVLFNIITDKMCARYQGDNVEPVLITSRRRQSKKRRIPNSQSPDPPIAENPVGAGADSR